MATRTYPFNFGASNYALTDRALTASITYARDSTDNAAKFTCTTKGMAATIEGGWGAATGVTWETWDVPAGGVVTQVQVTAWTEKTVAVTKLTANSVKMRILSGTTSVHSAGELIDTTCGTTADGTYQNGAAGTARAVDASYQASTTKIRFEIEQSFTTSGSSGSASVDQRYDGITLTITFTMPSWSAAGAISTITGALTKQTGAGKAGAISTITGAFAKAMAFNKSVAGSISSLAGLVKNTSYDAIAGAITSLVGAVATVRGTSASIGGSAASSGDVVKATGRGLAGALSSWIGTLTTEKTGGQKTESLSGAMASAGAVGKSLGRALAGTVSSLAGALANLRIACAVELRQNTTLIATRSMPFTASLATYEFALTTEEAALIDTNTDGLNISFVADGRQARVTWHEVKIPRGVSGPQTFYLTVTGVASSVASLFKQTARVVTATVTLSGTTAHTRYLLATGTATSAGTLTSVIGKMLAGAMASAATLVKWVAKLFAGSAASGGVLTNTKVLLKTLTGAMASSATLLGRLAGTMFAGTIGVVGALTKRPAKTFVGTGGSAGALSRVLSLFRTYTGGMASSGALVTLKVFLRTLTGTLASSATLAGRLATRLFTGALASAGALTKRDAMVWAGTVSSGGVLTRLRSVARVWTGSTVSVGALRLRVNKTLTGAIGIVGGFSRNFATILLDGALALTGLVSKARQKALSGALAWAGGVIGRWLGHNPEWTGVINVTLTGPTANGATLTGSTALAASLTGATVLGAQLVGPTVITRILTGSTALDAHLHP